MPSIQLKRGNANAVKGYTGPVGEIVVDMQNWNLALQDGRTAGGVKVGNNAKEISAPEIISPLYGSANVKVQPTIQTSNFAGNGVHVASQWQIATDEAFTAVVVDSGRTTSDLLQYSLANAGKTLTAGTTYYTRALHESSTAGKSVWSQISKFST